MSEIIATVLKILFFILVFVFNTAALLTWVERKQSALMQDRVGANRARIFGLRLWGLFHILADSLKMFLKEDYRPRGAETLLFWLAPGISMFFALVAFAAIPFADSLVIGGRAHLMQIAPLNIGILYVLATMSMAVYGVVLGAWASNNNYSLMGGLRASAQMISYEVGIGVSLIGVLLVFQTVNLQEIVRAQGALLGGWLPKWGILYQPIGFLLFFTTGLAETKRIPFDAPEGESEIIGYHVEFSSMRFGMYFLTDLIETVLIACITVTLFLGGWQVPYLTAAGFEFPWGGRLALSNLSVTVLQFLGFSLKVAALLWFMMLIRWTLPRFRYDQVMALGWKILLPLALLNIFVTAAVILFL
ncbi:MAG: NADH-quinone oxidoreductase subunit H [candidate division KSB1 bacterium]|nr:NADH-quinone oxidoreductase subunit H [candidate division KSB1 bacterium]MDZ7272683.1 NADH-quinone oxidoreductase subunit H [candidate division KSB1 bacterium]MDZ7284295.1 NADH-quinone oxidoreductase subunit H [candidate division KSB1 bacterium]MDZ7297309.1 NADH-quinone oxidoreductase subunit H [candidate division KSB1 bacterium]MDZ7309010.1 NADH-quinone oxidoreductase subunit H [candidate division KSB1 bacterium]